MANNPGGIAALGDRIPFLLSQLGSDVADKFQEQMAAIGIAPRTYAVLMALAGEDGQSQRQLSERLGIHRNVMVTLVDTLEADGLVARMARPDDRRAFAVTLTENARRLLPRLDEVGQALEVTVTAPLSTEECATLRALLQRVAGAAGLIPGVHPGLTR